MGWQWSAGCGADAQPFFRIFNPTTQGERFDPEGEYVRTWVRELENVPTEFIHTPWGMPAELQAQIAFEPGRSYPLPIVDHKEARARALAAYEQVRSTPEANEATPASA
jgi:deoxyribodipyrimidine photo-lyase